MQALRDSPSWRGAWRPSVPWAATPPGAPSARITSVSRARRITSSLLSRADRAGSPVGGANRGRAAVDLDALTGVAQRAAVPLEHPQILLHHVADHDRPAVGRERDALRPVPDGRLGDPGERDAGDAEQHELAVVVVVRALLGAIAAVLGDHGDEAAIRRDLGSFRRLGADRDGVDHARLGAA